MIGNARNNAKKKTSALSKLTKNIVSTAMKNVLINIPIPIENPTNPFLYSFFQG